MGLLNKFKNIPKRFRPIDLNEENVDAIFERCIASNPSNVDTSILRYTTFSEMFWIYRR